MGKPSEKAVREVLLQLGWPPVAAHFLALLLTRGQVSTAQAMEATGCTLPYLHTLVRNLRQRGVVDAWEGPSEKRGRAMNVYRLRRPRAFLASLVKQARGSVAVLERVELPKLERPSGPRLR